MPETEQVLVEEAAAPVVPGAVEETPADEEGGTPTIPKPRFDEVLTRAKASEQEVRDLKARVHGLESKATQTPQTPTLEQVLGAYDKGQITEIQKDQWVHYLAKEGAKQEFGMAIQGASMLTRAQSTTAEYVKAMPTLSDTASPAWRTLSETYRELLSLGHADGVVTQAMALRMAFGPLKGPGQAVNQEPPRSRSDTFLEGGSSGGGHMTNERDPLKDVPEKQIAFWKSKGYTKAQMAAESKMRGVNSIEDYRRMKPKKA